MGFIESEADEFQTDEDSDYVPSTESDGTSNSTINGTDENSSMSDVNLDDVVALVNDGALDETIGHDLSLRTVSKRRSTSQIWKYFGHLLYKLATISKVSNKLFCKICFDTGCLKRYAIRRLLFIL